MLHNAHHDRLIEAIKRDVPRRPGVYLFRDERGATLYIGKSVDLRQRMLSYFRQDLAAAEGRLGRMVYSIRDFTFRQAASELLALIHEDALIKQEMPPYNVRQREYLEYCYLMLTDDDFPTGRIVHHTGISLDHRVFGPFRDRYRAREILDLLQQHLGLRSCEDPEPVNTCLNFEIGRCRGPCRGKISERDYAEIVKRVVAFLSGDATAITDELTAATRRAAAGLDFEKAAELQGSLDSCRKFCARQSFLLRFQKDKLVLEDSGPPALTYRFERGLLADAEESGERPEAHLAASCGGGIICGGNAGGGATLAGDAGVTPDAPDARMLMDRASIVHGWIRRHRKRCRYRFLPA